MRAWGSPSPGAAWEEGGGVSREGGRGQLWEDGSWGREEQKCRRRKWDPGVLSDAGGGLRNQGANREIQGSWWEAKRGDDSGSWEGARPLGRRGPGPETGVRVGPWWRCSAAGGDGQLRRTRCC